MRTSASPKSIFWCTTAHRSSNCLVLTTCNPKSLLFGPSATKDRPVPSVPPKRIMLLAVVLFWLFKHFPFAECPLCYHFLEIDNNGNQGQFVLEPRLIWTQSVPWSLNTSCSRSAGVSLLWLTHLSKDNRLAIVEYEQTGCAQDSEIVLFSLSVV